MKINTYKLYYKTQSKIFLSSMVLVIIVLGLIISTILNSTKKEIIFTKSTLQNLQLLSQNELNKDIYRSELKIALENPKIDMEELVEYIEALSYCLPQNTKRKVIESTIDELDKSQKINLNYGNLISFLKVQIDDQQLPQLIQIASQVPTVKYANRLLSFYYWQKKEMEKALDTLKIEPTIKESDQCKERLVKMLIDFKKTDELEKLSYDTDFEKQRDTILKFILLEKKSWTLLFKEIIRSQIDFKLNGIFYLTLLTGIIWFGIWLHALRPEKLMSAICLSLIAFFLGVFSTSLTILSIYIEEDIYHMQMGTSLLQGVLYFILGVGLREEFFKALVFIILVPILVKRNKPIEWLIIPGMVGLGFATEENLNYFLASNGTDLPGRFLLANFFHVGLTALVGESICYYFYNRTRGIEHLISTFSMAVIIHGIYDAFMVVHELSNLSFVSIIVLIFIAFQFFGRLKNLRSTKMEPISISTHFIFGLSILFMSTFIYFSYGIGHFYAFQLLMPSIISYAVIIYMFLYVMPNSIIKL